MHKCQLFCGNNLQFGEKCSKKQAHRRCTANSLAFCVLFWLVCLFHNYSPCGVGLLFLLRWFVSQPRTQVAFRKVFCKVNGALQKLYFAFHNDKFVFANGGKVVFCPKRITLIISLVYPQPNFFVALQFQTECKFAYYF